MADENAAPSDIAAGRQELGRRLLDPGTHKLAFGSGRVFDQVNRVVPVNFDAIVDSDRSQWGREKAGCTVEPVDAITRFDPASTLVVIHSMNSDAQEAQLAALGPFESIQARALLELDELASNAPEERRFLWRVLSIAADTPFAIYGAGEAARVALALCRRLRREPVVVFDEGPTEAEFEGIPIRDPVAGCSEFRPELILDAREVHEAARPPDATEKHLLSELARRAWADWRSVCDDLARQGYAKADSFDRWNDAHRRLYRRFAMIPSLGLPEESVASLTSIVRPEREETASTCAPRICFSQAIGALRTATEAEPLASLFRGKRVALVGPSEHLLEERLGPSFDASDCVVRLNTTLEHLPIDRHMALHLGGRTDVLYLSAGYASKLVARRRPFLERLLDDAPLRAIVCLDSVLSVGRHGVEAVAALGAFRDLLAARRPDIAFRVETGTPRLIVPWLSGCAPRMGFGAITDLLTYAPARLSVAGFTFYHGGGHLFRGEVAGRLDPTLSNDGRICTHDSRRELACLRGFAADPALPLEFDRTLVRLLETCDADVSAHARPADAAPAGAC